MNIYQKVKKNIISYRNFLFGSKQDDSEIYLVQARDLIIKCEFLAAHKCYENARHCNPNNLECYIGIALCQYHLDMTESAIKTMLDAEFYFGKHDAILTLLVRCFLKNKSWEELESYWYKLDQEFNEKFPEDFYILTSKIYVSLLKSGTEFERFSSSLLERLIFQQDSSVSPKSNPILCSILFHYHEYDRPFYLFLLQQVKRFIEMYDSTFEYQKTTATIMLTFGLVDTQTRERLLETYFESFDLYSHWSFVLIGSGSSNLWDESMLSSVDSITIVRKIIKNKIFCSDVTQPALLYRMVIITSICCRDQLPILIKYIKNTGLSQTGDLDGYREDLSFIVQQHDVSECNSSAVVDIKRPLNIAFCVSGQLRGYKKAFESWTKLGLADHNVTYIVHTWSDIGESTLTPPKDVRSLPPQFQMEFRSLWNKLGPEVMKARYQHFFSLWPDNGDVANVKSLKKFYGSDFVFVDDDSEPPFNHFSNPEKMYYKIWQCQNKINEFQEGFDLVVRIRPDIEFTENINLDWYEIYIMCLERQVLFCEEYYSGCPTYMFPNIGYCMPDLIAITTPDLMNRYASAYKMTLREDSNMLCLKHFPREFKAHTNVAYSTLYNGIIVEGIPLPCKLVFANKPSREMMIEALQMDARERNDCMDILLLEALYRS
ncbi:TPA: hypothetical protein PXM64_003373 [Yersinia enterocolitica]|nr:hypothetical protein [Yersinia enterocolitica]